MRAALRYLICVQSELVQSFYRLFVSDYNNDADLQGNFDYSDNNVEKICSVSGSYLVLATVAPNICRSLTWDLLHVTRMVSVILNLLVDFWKVCAPLLLF